MIVAGRNSPIKNTSYKVVLPFYGYAAVSFLIATVLILINTTAFTQHYFNPPTLAITHVMALGWGTMIILGASHQLFPVLIEGKLHSELLAYLSFIFAGLGIPILVYAFYKFNLGTIALLGGTLINLAVIAYLVNLWLSISYSKSKNVHAIFALTAVLWLFTTTLLGLLMVLNFTTHIFSENSVHYLSLHAHMGIIGWFLLMIIGVGSRLIPMFLISKYENEKQLWWVYFLINGALLSFILLFFSPLKSTYYIVPIILTACSVLLFGKYIYSSYTQRIRKKVDEQVQISMLSVALAIVPILVLIAIILFFTLVNKEQLALLYGFTIFFGWITSIILGMTFKTMPFIIWNKVYSSKAGLGKTPNPKELFNNNIFIANGVAYLIGLIIFSWGIIQSNVHLLNVGAIFLIITAVLYNMNVFKIYFHKAK
ncbi:MAG TPA: hypothetical protein VLZ75_03850 [Chitinophagales bacterium]|nr:hypothetical protein [Chitinophagales bacterium]